MITKPSDPYTWMDQGSMCFYGFYEDPSQPNTVSKSKNSTAWCGFNSNGYAYCDQMKGDIFYANYLRTAWEFYQKSFDKCHFASSKGTECKQAGDY